MISLPSKSKYLFLSLIILISLFIKINNADFNEPIFIDGQEYNTYAWNFIHDIRPLPVIHNIGFALFLIPFFYFIHNQSFTELLQLLITITISTLTIPLFYKLARRLFDWKFSLIATCLIAFEPHIIQNATFGITEPMYLFLSIAALYLVTSRNSKYVFMSFLVAGFATITRFEGFILLVVMFIIFFYQYRLSKRTLLLVIPFVLVFLVPISFSTIMNLDYGTKENVISAKVTHDLLVVNQVSHKSNHVIISKILSGIFHLGSSTYPVFMIFTPLWLFYVTKNKPINPILLFIVLGIISFSGLFAYLRAYDTRYFMPLYPALAILSTYGVFCFYKSNLLKKIWYKLNNMSDDIFVILALACVPILGIYVIETASEQINISISSTIIVYPTFTLAAYNTNGFYNYYKGLCDQTCLTIPDSFDRINKITYNSYGLDTIRSLKIPMISDNDLDSNPGVLTKYHTVIVLHNEYVTQKEFDALNSHAHVLYLYPNALYALVKKNSNQTITLIRGHNYPEQKISNGFGWKYDNSPLEYSTSCKGDVKFVPIGNGAMLNCYPQKFINTQKLWSMVENFTKSN